MKSYTFLNIKIIVHIWLAFQKVAEGNVDKEIYLITRFYMEFDFEEFQDSFLSYEISVTNNP